MNTRKITVVMKGMQYFMNEKEIADCSEVISSCGPPHFLDIALSNMVQVGICQRKVAWHRVK
jgi:hypothetical protein